MQMPGHSDECFLNQVLCSIRVAGFTRYKMNETITVPVVEPMECRWSPLKVRRDKLLVREVVEGAIKQILTHDNSLGVHLVFYQKV